MNIDVVGTDQSHKWRLALDCFPSTDVYYMAQYHRAYELNGDGTALAFIAREAERILFYPFFVRPINNQIAQLMGGTWYDIETVHGYTGPLCTTHDANFWARALSRFHEWCRQMGVVAEFVRFNPFLETYQRHEWASKSWIDREIVVVPLGSSDTELWSGYPSSQRNQIRSAEKARLTCEVANAGESRLAFMRLHKLTMERNDVGDKYSKALFDFLWNDFGRQTVLLVVRFGNEIIASGLFLVHDRLMHYHFGNSNPQYGNLRATNLLLHTAAQWGIKNGCSYLNLGGGRTAAPDDRLLRFKLSISRKTMPYWLGRRVHHEEGFRGLCSTWLKVKGETQLPHYSFPYRL